MGCDCLGRSDGPRFALGRLDVMPMPEDLRAGVDVRRFGPAGARPFRRACSAGLSFQCFQQCDTPADQAGLGQWDLSDGKSRWGQAAAGCGVTLLGVVIETERLLLRRVTIDDIDEFVVDACGPGPQTSLRPV
jgi:hypothetical protein